MDHERQKPLGGHDGPKHSHGKVGEEVALPLCHEAGGFQIFGRREDGRGDHAALYLFDGGVGHQEPGEGEVAGPEAITVLVAHPVRVDLPIDGLESKADKAEFQRQGH